MTALEGILLHKKARLIVVDEDCVFEIRGIITKVVIDNYFKSCDVCIAGKDPKLIQKRKKK